MYKYILILSALLLFSACQDNTPGPAEEMSKEKLLTTPLPGYQWFYSTYTNYTPNDSIMNLIKSTFDLTKDTIIIFSKPACSCGDIEAESFAQLVKIFDVAGIPESNYKIYSMSSIKSSHPYSKRFELNQLPTYIVTSSGTPVYSIYDTIFVEEAKSEPYIKSIEAYLLLGLEKL
ncbi:MAG: hypothetical protein WCR42_13525 [bacterium]